MVDVYDGAYAEAHVGLLNFHVDIVRAFICFKGHIGYDLNVLKVSDIALYYIYKTLFNDRLHTEVRIDEPAIDAIKFKVPT